MVLFLILELVLRFNQAAELSLYFPAGAIALSISNFQNELHAVGVEGMDVDPLAVLYHVANYLLGLRVLLHLCHAVETVFVDPKAGVLLLSGSMLLNSSGADRDQARIRVIEKFFL